jgi:hypothetical protein
VHCDSGTGRQLVDAWYLEPPPWDGRRLWFSFVVFKLVGVKRCTRGVHGFVTSDLKKKE